MLCIRLATIVAALASPSLSHPFTFGAINPLSRLRSSRAYPKKNHVMGGAQSSPAAIAAVADSMTDNGDIKNDELADTTRSTSTVAGSAIGNGDHTKDSSNMMISQQPAPYTIPSSPVKPLAHYIFLVHGWLGNDLEMAYLSTAFNNVISPSELDGSEQSTDNNNNAHDNDKRKRAKRSSSTLTQQLLAQQQQMEALTNAQKGLFDENENLDAIPDIIVHSVKCNVGKTTDGIRNGGTRLANEMINFIRSDVEKRLEKLGKKEVGTSALDKHVTYSIVGNSLGGLYARYAISLLPYRLRLFQNNDMMLDLHPNVFCTTATPHLGVSRHTFLPIPRIAETIIGTGMGTTGRDLFRLNSEKDMASAAAGGIVGAAVGGVAAGMRRWSGVRPDEGDSDSSANNAEITVKHDDEEELSCIIHRMCLHEKFLTPLRNFRQRIAYANAYGTDFQVPTETAAFLNEKSGVGHFVMASRDVPEEGSSLGSRSSEKSMDSKGENNGDANHDGQTTPPFIVAVVRTEKQSRPQSPTIGNGSDTLSDELLRMSQSLDALGWTKVFIDVRDRIPVRGVATPAWMRSQYGSLDNLISERVDLTFTSLETKPAAEDVNANNEEDTTNKGDDASKSESSDAMEESPRKSPPKAAEATSEEKCILTSQELVRSTKYGDSLHFPLGHTVMVANSKSEGYSKLNSAGRPVMDRLAEDLVDDVLEFE